MAEEERRKYGCIRVRMEETPGRRRRDFPTFSLWRGCDWAERCRSREVQGCAADQADREIADAAVGLSHTHTLAGKFTASPHSETRSGPLRCRDDECGG